MMPIGQSQAIWQYGNMQYATWWPNFKLMQVEPPCDQIGSTASGTTRYLFDFFVLFFVILVLFDNFFSTSKVFFGIHVNRQYKGVKKKYSNVLWKILQCSNSPPQLNWSI